MFKGCGRWSRGWRRPSAGAVWQAARWPPWPPPAPTELGARSGDQRTQARMPCDQRELLRPAIQTPNMPRMLADEEDENARIDDVIVDDEIILALDERPIHVRGPVHQHQRYAERCTDADHQADQQREPDQQVAIGD